MRGLLLSLLFVSTPSQAAWVTIQNDTKQTLIVQELVTVRGKLVAGKPVKLLPGEKLREFQPGPGVKTVQILEPGLVAKLLSRNSITVKDADLSLSLQVTGGQIKLVSALQK